MNTHWSALTRATCMVLASMACADAQETKSGSIVGAVRFTGVVPPAQKIMTSDGAVLMHHDLVVDAKSRGLRFVAVVVEGAAPQALAKNAKPALIDQRDMVFLPRVIAVQEGQSVRFENNDLFNHAVMSTSIRPENLFNVVTPSGQPFEFKFKAQKNPVQIGCPIHPWMRAWVYVLPHAQAAVTDAQGKFELKGVPPGKHTVQFAHPDTSLRETRVVEVMAGKTAQMDVVWQKTTK